MSKTALITGASVGIGYELALLMAKDKYNLVIVARSEDKLQALKEKLEQECGIKVWVIAEDLSKENAAQIVFDKVINEGLEIDVLVNNAGFGDFGKFAETDWEKEARMMQLNMIALTHFTKLFAKGMVARGSGKIMNVASTASYQPIPYFAVYAASKAYVLSFSEAIAYELRETGVTVTALCPGATDTEFAKAASMENSSIFKGGLPTGKDVAEFGYRKMNSGATTAIHGLKNYILANSNRFAPRKMSTAISGWMVSRNT